MAVRTLDELKQAAMDLLRDDAPDFSILPSEARGLLGDFLDSIPSLGLTADQARDAAGALLATLGEFEYDARTNTLSLDLSAYEPVAPRFYFGVFDGASPTAADATIPAPEGTAQLPALAGKRVAIYRLRHDPDITAVRFGDDPSANAIGDFSRSQRRGRAYAAGLPSGLDYKVWQSRAPITKAAPVALAVS